MHRLSQLQTVSHAKDKVIKEEREQRIRQMEKFQQDVAKMPPAAVSELTGTDMSKWSYIILVPISVNIELFISFSPSKPSRAKCLT